jgi:hypothetical protein
VKTKAFKYDSEMKASDAAHSSYTRNIKEYGEENCKILLGDHVIILERPDTFEGVIAVRYEW